MSSQLIGIADLSRLLGVSAYTVRRLIARGDVIAVNIGARRLVPESEVERIIRHGVGQVRSRKANAANPQEHTKRIPRGKRGE